MKSRLFVVFMLLVAFTNSGCSASFWKGWGKGLAGGKTAGVDDLPAGSMPASRIGEVAPYQYRSYESWGGGSYKEKRTMVYIQEIHFLDGSIKRSVVKVPLEYSGSWYNINQINYHYGVVDDPAGWKAAGIVYGPKRPNFKR